MCNAICIQNMCICVSNITSQINIDHSSIYIICYIRLQTFHVSWRNLYLGCILGNTGVDVLWCILFYQTHKFVIKWIKAYHLFEMAHLRFYNDLDIRPLKYIEFILASWATSVPSNIAFTKCFERTDGCIDWRRNGTITTLLHVVIRVLYECVCHVSIY